MAVGEIIKSRKKGKLKQYHSPINLRLLGRISNGERYGYVNQLGDGKFSEENKDLKNEVGEEYKVVWNLIHPWKKRRKS